MLEASASIYPLSFELRRGPVDAHLVRGMIPFRRNLDYALKYDPHSSDLYFNLTILNLFEKNIPAAEESFGKMMQLLPRLSRLSELRRAPPGERATTD